MGANYTYKLCKCDCGLVAGVVLDFESLIAVGEGTSVYTAYARRLTGLFDFRSLVISRVEDRSCQRYRITARLRTGRPIDPSGVLIGYLISRLRVKVVYPSSSHRHFPSGPTEGLIAVHCARGRQ